MKCLLVSPSVAHKDAGVDAAFNGNAHTAQRWAQMLQSLQHSATVVPSTQNLTPALCSAHDVLIALHARRSADAVEFWRGKAPKKPLVVVLTGTDVYRDIQHDVSAKSSLDAASHLVVLQSEAVLELALPLRGKSRVIVQSAQGVRRLRPADGKFRVLMVGHLREEKDAATFMRAAGFATGGTQIAWRHIGAGLDEALLLQARQTELQAPSYHHLGALGHAATLQEIADADLLVHASRMEGGAHVIAEAVACGTPVLASRISGNVGMLGRGYTGYFELGNAQELAREVRELAADASKLAHLAQQCALRAPLFAPDAERANLAQLMQDCAQRPKAP